MAERYASRGRTMARSNTKQAWLPRDCEILDNPVGTACGFVVRHPASHGQSRLFFTPGVPFEFQQMVREQIMPRLKALAGEETDTELRRFYTFGVSESALSDMLDAAPGLPASSWATAPPCPHRAQAHRPRCQHRRHGRRRGEAACGHRPWLVGRGNEAPASQILALLGSGRCTCRKGESRGALLTMCHGHPALTAGFSHTLSDDLTQLAVPAAP